MLYKYNREVAKLDFDSIKLPVTMVEILDVIYKKAKSINPKLDQSEFLQRILEEWLSLYKHEAPQPVLPKDKVLLKNRLKPAIRLSGKSQSQIAREIGVNRTYLNQVINGKCEPSIVLALLLMNAVSYPAFKDLFYLEPAE